MNTAFLLMGRIFLMIGQGKMANKQINKMSNVKIQISNKCKSSKSRMFDI
jgi:hypothetical protein